MSATTCVFWLQVDVRRSRHKQQFGVGWCWTFTSRSGKTTLFDIPAAVAHWRAQSLRRAVARPLLLWQGAIQCEPSVKELGQFALSRNKDKSSWTALYKIMRDQCADAKSGPPIKCPRSIMKSAKSEKKEILTWDDVHNAIFHSAKSTDLRWTLSNRDPKMKELPMLHRMKMSYKMCTDQCEEKERRTSWK